MNVVVKESGGLGNQLFQYAAGKYYARRYGAALRIAVDPPWNAHSNGYPRPCLLSHFSVKASLAERSIPDRIYLTNKPWLKLAAAPFRRAGRIQVFTEQREHRYRFLRDLPLEQPIETLYLSGYFQTHLLVEEIAAELREDLAFRDPAQGRNLATLQQISRSNSVSVHIRRGDALLLAEGKVVLPVEYFHHAMSMIRQQLADPVFFIFSDDMPFVKERLPRDGKVVFVDHNDDFAAHEDLRLMSACRHHVIANSTFSWWGAWLDRRPDKIVVAPRHWFRGATSCYPELLPLGWLFSDIPQIA